MSCTTKFTGYLPKQTLVNYFNPVTTLNITSVDKKIPKEGTKIISVKYTVNIWVDKDMGPSRGLVIYSDLPGGTDTDYGKAYPRYISSNKQGKTAFYVSKIAYLPTEYTEAYEDWEFTGLTNSNKASLNDTYLSAIDYDAYYKNKTTITMTLSPTTRKSSGYVLSTENGTGYVTCEVEWDYTYKRPSIEKFTMTPDEIQTPPDASVSIPVAWKFTMPAEAENLFNKAILCYKKSTDSSWNETYTTTSASGSANITVPTIKGTYYYTWEVFTQDPYEDILGDDYCIRIGNADNIQRTLTVTEVGEIGAPLNFRIGEIGSFSGTVYLGTEDAGQSLIFDWDPAADGTNNSVQSYTLFGPNGPIESGITASNYSERTVNLAEGSYYVRAIGKSGYKDSDYATIRLIATPSAPGILSTLPEKLNESSTIEWSAVNKTDGVTDVKYEIFNNNTRLTTTPETSFVLQRSMITAGVNNVIKIRTIAYARAGTYSYSSYRTIGTTTKTESFTMPENFWVACYDSGNGLTSGIYPIAHKNIMFKWTAITTTTSAQGTIFNYELQYSDSETGVYQTLNPNNTTSVTGCSVPLDGVAEGTTRFYRVKVTNEFNQVEYSPIIRVTKIKPVAAENVTATSINYNTMQANFGWVRTLDKSADSLSYKINLHYNNQSATIYSETEMTKEPDVSVLNIPDLPTNLNNSALRTLTNLKTAVIANKLAHPTAQLEIVMWYTSFPSTKKSTITDIRLDYTTAPTKYGEITLEQYTDSNGNSRDYYNPGDEVVVNLNGFEWCDAAGNTGENAGATVTTYLTSSYSTNKFIFTNNIARIIVPEMAEDETIVLTLAADVVYTDDKREFKSSQAVTVNAARWTKEAIYVDSIKAGGTETEIEGQLQLPTRLCSSSKTGQENLVSITPVLSKPSSSEGYNVTFYNKDGIITNIFDKTNLSTDRKIDFKITANNTISDITLTFDVIFVNTSNNELQVTAAPYRYFIAEVDLAIRKGRVGVNVGKDYGLGDNSNATLQINAGQETGSESPIVEIFTAQKSTTDTAVRFLALGDNGGAENSISYVYKQNNKIFIDNLYHPPANSLTNGTLTLDFNNTGLILSGDKGGTILTEKNYSDYIVIKQDIVSTSADGLAPKITAAGTLTNSSNDRVLATKNGALGWYTLPAEAFKDTTYGVATTSSSGLMSSADKAKLNSIDEEANNYTLPIATSSSLGGIIVGDGLSIYEGQLSISKNFFYSTSTPSQANYGDLWFKPINREKDYDFTILSRSTGDTFIVDQDTYTVYIDNLSEQSVVVGKIKVNSFGNYSTMKITAVCGVEKNWDFAMFTQPGQSFGNTYTHSALKAIGQNNDTSLLKCNFNNYSSNQTSSYTETFTYNKSELENKYIEVAYIKDSSGDFGNSNYNSPLSFTISFE